MNEEHSKAQIFHHPYKSPEFEDISLVTDVPEDDKVEPKTTVTTTVTETILPREEEKGRFHGSEISHPYKFPDIEGISMYTEPAEDVQPKGTVTVITETVTVEEPNKDTDDIKPKEKKDERGTFKGSDIAHPYRTPEIEDISLATNLPEQDQPDDKLRLRKTVTTVVTETHCPKKRMKGENSKVQISLIHTSLQILKVFLCTLNQQKMCSPKELSQLLQKQ